MDYRLKNDNHIALIPSVIHDSSHELKSGLQNFNEFTNHLGDLSKMQILIY